MPRDHDGRSRRTRELTVEDQRLAKLKLAFEQAPTIINARQAAGIAELMTTGKQASEDVADPVPMTLAIAGSGRRVPDPTVDPHEDPAAEESRQAQTLALLSEDGRMWSCTPIGACWPGGARHAGQAPR